MSTNDYLGLHGWFQRGLASSEREPAVQVGPDSLSYGSLHETALLWAGSMRRAVGAVPAIGILGNKSATAYTGVLAALYAGAAVVPLNPDFPAHRIRRALETANVSAVIADGAGVAALPELADRGRELAVLAAEGINADGFQTVSVSPSAALSEPVAVDPTDNAYVLFTSGSTGRPKGVPITHGSADAYFQHVQGRYGFGPDDVFSQTFDLSFDCAIFDLFAAWGSGARLRTVNQHAFRDLPGFIAQHGVTVWFSTPATISLLRRLGMLTENAMPSLRWSFFAGEALKVTDAVNWSSAAPKSVLENIYGPTELTITVSAHRWSAEESPRLAVNGIVPIGRVHPGHDHVLVQPDGTTAELDGELCITGPQMTRGYLDPEDDSRRFLLHGSQRWFRTGDRVRKLPNGELAYLGRTDTQVQVHGLRVEPGEVEHALRDCPGLDDAVVVAVASGDTSELFAFHTGRPVAPRDLSAFLHQRLPAQMVPRRFQHIETFPLNHHGKINRSELGVMAQELFDGLANKKRGSESGSGPTRPRLVHEILDAAAAEAPNRSAVRDDSGFWTYSELVRKSHMVERWLGRRGVERGDRVVVQARTDRELVALFFGTVRRGAAFVPLNPDMRTFHLREVLANADPRVVLVPAGTAAEVRRITDAPVMAVEEGWEEIGQHDDSGTGPVTEVSPDDIAALVYTSGSTASPKAVVCPHAQMSFASEAIATVLGYRPDDVVLCRFPMSWDYGLYKILLAFLGRSEIVLADAGSDLRLLDRIRETGATIVPLVPSLATILVTLARREDAPIPSVRMFTNTGAALPAATMEALRKHFHNARIVRQFGLTECKRISIMPPAEEHERPDSVGLPLPGTEVLILGPDGRSLPPGEVGEIVAVGPHVMPGYWRIPEVTRRVFQRGADGRLRLHTGDYGWLDDDNYLYFAGRRDDMFKRKGIRMSTLEIENAATDIPGVRGAVAVPPEDDRDLVVFVAASLPPHEVLRELSRRLEPAKVPAVCRVVEELPLTPNGKYSRKALAELLKEAQ